MKAAATLLLALLLSPAAHALVANQTIPAGEKITPDNTSDDGESEFATGLIGREVKRTVYAGQSILPDNTRAARIVLRNQLVEVRYIDEGLLIIAGGRSMADAGEGEVIEVMNLQSRKLIHGTVTPEGWVLAQ